VTKFLSKRSDRFSETTIDDEVVVMNLDSGDFFSLTGTARAAWILIDGSRDEGSLVAKLAHDYAMPEQVIAPQIGAFLADLEAAGLIGHD
jgi:hypothetical protein